MRILLLNWRDPKNPKAGGAEFVTMKHARDWAAAGHMVTWFTSSFRGAKPTELIRGVTITRWGGERSVILLAPIFYWTIRSTVDVVIDQIHGLPFFTPLFVRRPIVAFIHEIADQIWDVMYPFPINVLGRIFESLYFRLYRHVPFWTDARATINDLERHGIKAAHCHAIPCPIANTPLSRLSRKESVPTFLFVSRIVKMKGIEEVVRAFAIMAEALPAAKLWVIGAGERGYVNEMKRLAASLGVGSRVQWLGYVSEKVKLSLMRRAHILLHASIKEGWGLVVLEAASQGTPAVVYDVHGLSEVVLHGKTGIVTRHNTPTDLAREALSLIQDTKRYARYQRDGLTRVRQMRWSQATKESLALITQTYEAYNASHD